MRIRLFGALAMLTSVTGAAPWAQRGGGSEWLTAQGDAQRTSWIRNDANISVDALSKPGFELQWKSKLDNQPRDVNGLSQGVSANGVTLFVPLSLVTGSSNNVYAIDNDTGYLLWRKHFDAPLPAPTAACPGGITAAPTRIVSIQPVPLPAARGAAPAGRGGGGYRGSVGEPGEGAPVQARGAAPGGGRGAAAPAPGGVANPAGNPAANPGGTPGANPAAGSDAGAPGAAAVGQVPPAAGRGAVAPGNAGGGAGGGPGARGAGGGPAGGGIPGAPPGIGGGNGFGRVAGVVYAVSSDGILHVLGLPSGKDMQKPAAFLPDNARVSDLTAVGDTLYAATTQNCGGAPSGVWAIDLAAEAKPVTSWKTNGGGIVGAVALGTDGTVYAAVGAGQPGGVGYANAIVALEPKTLNLKDWYTQPTADFVSGPLVFRQGDRDIVAAATRDGRVLLLDSTSLGGATHTSPLYASRAFASGTTFVPEALAMWQEAVPGPAGAPAQPGTRWLLLPVTGRVPADAQLTMTAGAVTNGAIVALKVADEADKLSLQPGWVSRDLVAPVTPVVVNGVVFAASTGKPAAAAGASRGTPAVLYALNGSTGKELWSSGKTITSFLTGRSFWSANGQIYAGTYDGTIYAFGFAMERH